MALAATACASGFSLPEDTGQVIVATAESWTSHRGTLWAFARSGRGWRAEMGPVPVLFGRNGLAWGIGIHPSQQDPTAKREKDGCAPAGVFRIGSLYGEQPAPPPGTALRYHRIGPRDAWVDDPSLPDVYNRHVRLAEGEPEPPWFAKQRMRLGDSAYRWLLEIRHNSDPPVPGAGSAIFFHVRRGADRPSSGCTTMALGELEALIRWLRPEARPLYVLLPEEQYRALQKRWRLPALPADGGRR